MDANQFDAIARALVVQASRRRTLALVFGGALGLLGWAEIEASKSRKCKPACNECQYCQKGTCTKKNGKKTCKAGKCKPQGEGNSCTAPTGGTCKSGVCTCPAALNNCDGACRNLKTDNANCGTCGQVCTGTDFCLEGVCFPRDLCPANPGRICTLSIVPCAGSGSCFCERSTEGQVVCISLAATPGLTAICGSQACTTNANCPAGTACIDVAACCGGKNVCLPACPAPW